MGSRAKWEFSLLCSALAMGILADALLRALPWGLNFLLWMTALAAAIAIHVRGREETQSGASRWLPAALVLCALGLAWRDSVPLNLLSILAASTVFTLIMLQAQMGQIRRAGFVDYALGAAVAGLNAALGILVVLFGEREWRKHVAGRESRRALAVARGALFALPCLLVFGGLFMGADAVFDHIVRQTFHINFQKLFTHFFLVAFFAWCVGGYLRGMVWGKEVSLIKERRLPSVSIGTTEGAVVLGAVDLLFLAFVLVQVRYFFGGSTLVQATTGLTYAEYARRGFFQLFQVAVLVLPLLLLVHWLMAERGPGGERTYRVLAAIQLLLLFMVMSSAVQRMRLYQAEYGLTEERIYVTAFMGWLAVVFLWFAATVVRGRQEHFAFGTVLAGFALVIFLHFLNPDQLVVRTNLERAQAGRSFDARYAVRLSADAAPDLVAALPSLNPQDRCIVASGLLKRWGGQQATDWRTWNGSIAKAKHLVRENEASLKALHCPEPQGNTH